MSTGSPDPRPRVVRLNPGRLPEALALQGLSNGLAQVRGKIVRETAGAVSPPKQFLAIDAIMQRHHDGIAAVMSASRERHDRVLSADDTYRLVLSLVEHATMASYWLQIAWLFPKLPAKGRPDLSVAKSRAKRHDVLTRIRTCCQIAVELMDGLWVLLPGNPVIERCFRSISLQMLCVQVNATRHALFSASERKTFPRETFEGMLRELDAIRLEPRFMERSAGDRNMFWQAAALIYQDLGYEDRLRNALRERYALTAGNPDARATLLVQMMDLAETDEDRLARLAELTVLGRSSDPGPLFSQDRIGRISMFRDALWSTAASISAESPFAGPGVDEALECYRTWVFGRSAPMAENSVRLVSAWSGEGRVRWRSGGVDQVRGFEFDSEIVGRFVVGMEKMHARAMKEVIGFLDAHLGPLLAEAISGQDKVRVQAGGSIALLPLLMTTVGDTPLGASTGVAYAHPNPDVVGAPATVTPFELLVVDECFGRDSAKVRSVLQLAAEQASVSCRVLRFNSAETGAALAHDELEEALQSVSSAMLFCHVDTPTAYAQEAALITGPSSRLRVDALAALDLRSLDELAVIGCASGRANLFVGDVTVAHAAALAGARQITYSLWPIRPQHGANFVTELANARAAGQSTVDFLADQYRIDRCRAATFAIMRP